MTDKPEKIAMLFRDYMQAMAPVHTAREDAKTEAQVRRDIQSGAAREELHMK